MTKLLYVVNVFRDAAVPNILLDIVPFLLGQYEIRVLSLETPDWDSNAVASLRGAGVPIDSLDCSRFGIARAFFRLRAYILHHTPDLVHSHLGRADILTPLAAPRGTATISTLHNVKRGHSIATRIAYRVVDRCIDYRTAVSCTVKDSWYKTGTIKAPCKVIYNPVDTGRLQPTADRMAIRDSLGIHIDAVVVTSVGRYVKQKALHLLVQMLPSLLHKIPSCVLVLCGWGPLESNLRSLAHSLGVEDRVIFTGALPSVGNLLHITDLFVTSSLFEGHSVALVEAMAVGLPIVSSPNPSNAEILSNGIDALLVDPRDREIFADAVAALLCDSDMARALGMHARQRYLENFTPRTAAEQLDRVYRNLTKDAPVS